MATHAHIWTHRCGGLNTYSDNNHNNTDDNEVYTYMWIHVDRRGHHDDYFCELLYELWCKSSLLPPLLSTFFAGVSLYDSRGRGSMMLLLLHLFFNGRRRRHLFEYQMSLLPINFLSSPSSCQVTNYKETPSCFLQTNTHTHTHVYVVFNNTCPPNALVHHIIHSPSSSHTRKWFQCGSYEQGGSPDDAEDRLPATVSSVMSASYHHAFYSDSRQRDEMGGKMRSDDGDGSG